jgi:dTDP-4-amino-4,6-dideoxy-D-galactose acyltransferase
MNAPCEFLEWDSAFFSRRIARVLGGRLDDRAAANVMNWCRRERIDCLYFLADADEPETTVTAETHGFGLTDVRLTYRRRLGSDLLSSAMVAPDGATLRPACETDLPALEAFVQDSYTESRFYFDRRFPRPTVSKMYQVWVRQSVLGEAEQVLVLETGGRAGGFIICRLLDEGCAQIALAGVATELRGLGLGTYLYEGALQWCAHQGLETVLYVTQARNIRAQRLIQQLGFLTESVQLWYHKWFEQDAKPQVADSKSWKLFRGGCLAIGRS